MHGRSETTRKTDNALGSSWMADCLIGTTRSSAMGSSATVIVLLWTSMRGDAAVGSSTVVICDEDGGHRLILDGLC